MKRLSFAVFGAAAVPLLLLGFQNCSKVGVSDIAAPQVAAATGNPANLGAPTAPSAATPPVVCDPLSSGGTTCDASLGGAGLLGNVYFLLNGVGVQNYINNGQKLDVTVLLTDLDVPDRDWTAGFPGANGTPLTEPDGSILNEWFAFDLNGKLQLPSSMSEGAYQFGFYSDDGAILYIDGQMIVNNDGTHSAQWKCGALVNLKHNEQHQIRVLYYQGPRYHIALQMFMRPASEQSQPCDNAAGGLQIVPAAALSH